MPLWSSAHWQYWLQAALAAATACFKTDRIAEAVDIACEHRCIAFNAVALSRGSVFLERAVADAQIFAVASQTTAFDVSIHMGNAAEGVLRHLYKLRPDHIVRPLADFLHAVAMD